MTVFSDLEFKTKRGAVSPDDVQARVDFDNGYGASVIRGPFSYGGEDGLYELAVMDKDGLCYDTPVTTDVEGRLTEDDVTTLLAQIKALPQMSVSENAACSCENGKIDCHNPTTNEEWVEDCPDCRGADR